MDYSQLAQQIYPALEPWIALNTVTYLPYAQRALNPVAATAAAGDVAQPWPITLLAFLASVNVAAPNNGANFWTITLIDTTGTIRATVSTAAIAATVWTRLSDSAPSQPATTNVEFAVIATTTGAPGAIYLIPAIAAFQTG